MKLRHSSERNIDSVIHIMTIFSGDYGRQHWEEIRANLVFYVYAFSNQEVYHEITE